MDVSSILIGHGHPDHCDPALLLARTWAMPHVPLEVHGPVSALESVRPWLDPALLDEGVVRLIAAEVGALVDLPSGHTARALPAEHGLGAHGHPRTDPRGPAPDAVLWEVTDPAGVRMLHAADTGPLPQSTVDLLEPLDLLLLEETFGDRLDHGTAHLDLRTFPEQLAALRAAGAVHEATEVVAVHLSHFNPAEPALVRRLAAWGVRAGRDLDVIEVPAAHPVTPPPVHRTFITGGARSGKSRAAEQAVAAHAQVHYVATAAPRAQDAEWDARVTRHRDRRPSRWTTHETAEVAEVIAGVGPGAAVLVDCVTLWVARLIDEAEAWDEPSVARKTVLDRAGELADSLRRARCRVVLVSNEVGSGIVPTSASVRMYQDLVGEVNSLLAAACDTTLLAIAGRIITVEGQL